MTPHAYLEDWLKNREKLDDSEVKEYQAKRAELEEIIKSEWGSKVSVRYSGSVAKGTAVRSSWDLDIALYFDHETFDSLKDMYESVRDVLKKHYRIREQRVSVGLPDLKVDVVPGRRLKDDPLSVNLYRTDTGRSLKTSIDRHIQYISESGARDTIKLLKIWRERWGLEFKSFALELLTIRALQDFEGSGHDSRVRHVFGFIADKVTTVGLEDPANSANNVADIVPAEHKTLMKETAQWCLEILEQAQGEEAKVPLGAWHRVYRDDLPSGEGSMPPVYVVRRRHEEWGHQPGRRHG